MPLAPGQLKAALTARLGPTVDRGLISPISPGDRQRLWIAYPHFSDVALSSFAYPDLPIAGWVIALFDASTGELLDFDVDIVAASGGATSAGLGQAGAIP